MREDKRRLEIERRCANALLIDNRDSVVFYSLRLGVSLCRFGVLPTTKYRFRRIAVSCVGHYSMYERTVFCFFFLIFCMATRPR